MAAVVSFAVVIALFLGVGLLLGGPDQPQATDVTQSSTTNPSVGGLVDVRHQLVIFSIMADLSCQDAVRGGSLQIELETWADFTNGRFRQTATYPDGSIRDKIALGDPDYPAQTFGQGTPQMTSPACGEDILAGDPTGGPTIAFFNSPVDSPNTQGYEELGTIFPGNHEDSQGRPAVLYREVIDGYETHEDGTEFPIHQVTEWYVDEGTGDVLETAMSQTIDGRYDLRTAFVVLTDEHATVDSSLFDTTGYQLEWDGDDGEQGLRIDADPIAPATTLGTEVIWPLPLEPAGPKALAERFAEEVLGWRGVTATPDPEASENAPTWIAISDSSGHELEVLAAPNGPGGWGLFQIGEPSSVGAAPLGYTAINPNQDLGAATVIIHAATRDGTTLAWQADLSAKPGIVVLTGLEMGDIMTLLVTYTDESGQVIAVNGGQFGP